MKKVILRSAVAALATVAVTAGGAFAAPIATGSWVDYEYYQKTSADEYNGYMGQLMQEGDSFDFYFDLAFLGFGSSGDGIATNSQLTFENDVEGYGEDYGTIPVMDLWAAISIFSIDEEAEGFNLEVDAFVNGQTYDLGLTQFAVGPNTQEGTYIFKFAGDLLSAWQQDPYGDVIISLSGMDDGYNDFNLTEVGIGVTPVPEPTTMLLFGAGLAGLAGLSRRKK